MIRIAVALIVLATSASAEPYWVQEKRMSLHSSTHPCFAVVRIENTMGIYNETEILQTQYGSVAIAYKTRGEHNATDDDFVEVVELPEGVVAQPLSMDLPDDDTGEICLMRYQGG